jgi:hypothetical protein
MISVNVLVQVLARAQAEEEATLKQCAGCRRHLGHQGGMVTDGGAGDAGAHLQLLSGLGDRAQDCPRKGAFTLRIDPGMEMVGEEGQLEAGFLGSDCVTDKESGRMLFGAEVITEANFWSHSSSMFPTGLAGNLEAV